MNRMDLSLQHLLRCADEGEDMLNRIATGAESWVHQPESTLASVQWKHPSSPSRHQLGRLCLPRFGIPREYC
jgi:hypothetical protein